MLAGPERRTTCRSRRPVVVTEVVCLPREGRHDNGDPVPPSRSRPKDEWRVPDARAGDQLHEVETGRLVRNPQLNGLVSAQISELAHRRHGGAAHLVARANPARLGACTKDLHPHVAGALGKDHHPGCGSGPVAVMRERSLDAGSL